MRANERAGQTQAKMKSLAWFAQLAVAAVYALIFIGAMVTSKGAGMAVPDWPLSFGSLNPPGWWRNDPVFWEHSHRLAGATVGLLTVTLGIWVLAVVRTAWVRWLAFAVMVGVILQGVLGGLRVLHVSTALAMVHGCTAQLFLIGMVALAVALSPSWLDGAHSELSHSLPLLHRLSLALPILVYLQVILGAAVRHSGAGLAIPDFPLALGHIIPPMLSHGVALHFTHRALGYLIVILAIWATALIFLQFRHRMESLLPGVLLGVLLILQVLLGGIVVWRLRAPIPTSLHVVNGAICLGLAVMFAMMTRKLQRCGSHRFETIPKSARNKAELARETCL